MAMTPYPQFTRLRASERALAALFAMQLTSQKPAACSLDGGSLVPSLGWWGGCSDLGWRCAFPTDVWFPSSNVGVRKLGSGKATMFMDTLSLYGAVFGDVLWNGPVRAAHPVGGALIIRSGVWAARGA